MRKDVVRIIGKALDEAAGQGLIGEARPDIIVETPKKEEFGDFSTNVAMLLAPLEKKPPVEIARMLAGMIAKIPPVEKAVVAGPGFINIFLGKPFYRAVLEDILKKGEDFGRLDAGKGRRVQVEFVSANPTGPLHIGHGRNAAVGDALANVLEAAGYEVAREYYINDVGRQMQTLGESIRLRLLELEGEDVEFPEDFYRGEYVKDIARDYMQRYQPDYAGAPSFQDFGREAMLERIKKDLDDFGVRFDAWYSEKSLHDRGLVMDTIEELRRRGFIYESEGALWFRTTDFGDDKDRVLIKADKTMTYFASDIAYHRDKAERGFSAMVDVWGADHHGYEARIRALFKALGADDARLKIIFIQLVALLRKGVPVPMGKREGEFVTLRQVMDEVGRDACRFFFLMRKSDAHLDFDLELAKSAAPENPVYYVQYCHARIKSIMAFAREKKIEVPQTPGPAVFDGLNAEEIGIIKRLGAFEEVVERSAAAMEPHRITFYLMELAGLFHPYYNRNRVVTDDGNITAARLLLCDAVGNVVANGLRLLGVEAPSKM